MGARSGPRSRLGPRRAPSRPAGRLPVLPRGGLRLPRGDPLLGDLERARHLLLRGPARGVCGHTEGGLPGLPPWQPQLPRAPGLPGAPAGPMVPARPRMRPLRLHGHLEHALLRQSRGSHRPHPRQSGGDARFRAGEARMADRDGSACPPRGRWQLRRVRARAGELPRQGLQQLPGPRRRPVLLLLHAGVPGGGVEPMGHHPRRPDAQARLLGPRPVRGPGRGAALLGAARLGRPLSLRLRLGPPR